jgi:hypothetical protein
MNQLDTAVVYLAYNRPRHVKKTFPAIRRAKPKVLFLVADGPKTDSETDFQNCSEVRRLIQNIDWPCEVFRNYADSNMGLKKRVSSGLSWVFNHVNEAIILEDDCLPHPDFFQFCAELLKRYESDKRIWTITGDNFQNGKRRGKASYYFSKYPHCWGWATWARAWKNYQEDIPFWPEWRDSGEWRDRHCRREEERHWRGVFDKVYAGKVNSWSFPWIATVWQQNGLTATPNVNLVSNIGFGNDGTHCLDVNASEIQPRKLVDLIHPDKVESDHKADQHVFMKTFRKEKAINALTQIQKVLFKNAIARYWSVVKKATMS